MTERQRDYQATSAEPRCTDCGETLFDHRYAKCRPCTDRLARLLNDEATPADLAWKLADTSRRLSASLEDDAPDHQRIGVLWGDLGATMAELDLALGLNVDELPLPAIPVTYGVGQIVSSGPRPPLVLEDDGPVAVRCVPGGAHYVAADAHRCDCGDSGPLIVISAERLAALEAAEAELAALREAFGQQPAAPSEWYLMPWPQVAFIATAEMHKSHGPGPWRECTERICAAIKKIADDVHAHEHHEDCAPAGGESEGRP